HPRGTAPLFAADSDVSEPPSAFVRHDHLLGSRLYGHRARELPGPGFWRRRGVGARLVHDVWAALAGSRGAYRLDFGPPSLVKFRYAKLDADPDGGRLFVGRLGGDGVRLQRRQETRAQ